MNSRTHGIRHLDMMRLDEAGAVTRTLFYAAGEDPEGGSAAAGAAGAGDRTVGRVQKVPYMVMFIIKHEHFMTQRN